VATASRTPPPSYPARAPVSSSNGASAAAAAAAAAAAGRAKASNGHVVDHRNFRKDFKTQAALAQEAIAAARAAENRRPEPVRRYPQAAAEWDSALQEAAGSMFGESLGGGARLPVPPGSTSGSVANGSAVGSTTSVTIVYEEGGAAARPDDAEDDADSDPTAANGSGNGRLKLDQSQLPLEIFDSAEAEARDRTPLQWLLSGSGAMVPFYSEGEWRWARCSVVNYLTDAQRFVVRLHADGREKHVKRFNLLFDAESRAEWEERRSAAESAREAAKARLRFDHYVAQQPMEELRAVQVSAFA
jgi:hypothetical protein